MTARDPLTVVVVGGAGAMGRHAVRAVARLGSASRLLIADLDLERAQLLADQLGAPTEAIKLDVTDTEGMLAVFADCDVVLNTMGPFSIFATRVLRAALDSKCDYLDIDDDPESTVEALALDDLARENGCRVVVGLGSSPGTTNMCAMVAAGRLDRVDELYTGWKVGAAVAEPEAEFPPSENVSAAL
jgi:saccharopine dehydrogenase (NAD+, L-lysine-forming)